MEARSRRARRSSNYWPGFVDALSTLVMVVIFVLLLFMVAQFFLSNALSGRDAALARLNQQINELSSLLALEKSSNEDLRVSLAQLAADLQSANQAKDDLTGQLAALLDSRAELEALLAAAQQKIVVDEKALEDAYKTIEADKETIEAQLAELTLLQALKAELGAALAAANESADDKDQQITALQAELSRAQAELSQVKTALAEAQAALTAAQIALAAQAQDLVAGQQALASAQEEIAESEEALTASAAEVERLKIALAEALTKLAAAEAEAEATAAASAATQEALAEQTEISAEAQAALAEQTELSAEAQRQVELLNIQLAALRQQLARLAAALEASEAKNLEQEVEIANLGSRLNEALASKVQELVRYRSEFFGRMRALLGEREDIRIVGDRFVFQSEVLFASGQAELGEAGRQQIEALAATLKELIPQMPAEVNWVLQVNGHTDRRPVTSAGYASNWELSQARALSVVRALIAAGIPAERLVAAGYAEFQPLDPADSDEAYRINRRIEIKLTER